MTLTLLFGALFVQEIRSVEILLARAAWGTNGAALRLSLMRIPAHREIANSSDVSRMIKTLLFI